MPRLIPVSYKQLVKIVRTEGDHMVLTKPGVIGPVVIPKYAAVPIFIIKNQFAHCRNVKGALLQAAW
jgi:hypothetical protein